MVAAPINPFFTVLCKSAGNPNAEGEQTKMQDYYPTDPGTPETDPYADFADGSYGADPSVMQTIERGESIPLGYVIQVTGSKVIAALQPTDNAVDDLDQPVLGLDVPLGSLVKIDTGRSVVIGVVNSVHIPQPSAPPRPNDLMTLDIDLFGESVGSTPMDDSLSFQRGVSIYPRLGKHVWSCSYSDLAHIYARPEAGSVRIGTLYQATEIPAFIVTNDLLGGHFAILGTTGSGKSCTTALILRSILAAHPNGHVIMLDPHNEYSASFGEMAEVLHTENLELPLWLLNTQEAEEVLCSKDPATRSSEASIMRECFMACRRQFAGTDQDTSWMTVDSPTPFSVNSLIKAIDERAGKLDKPENSIPYLRLKSRIERLKGDRRYQFMFSAMTTRDSLADILASWMRIPVRGKPVTVIDLSGVPTEVVDVVVSVLCRVVFEFAVWCDRSKQVPILIACEEAHKYIPKDESTAFEPTRKAIGVIAKEGRKYGVALCLITQRPSEISQTVLSQCNTLFVLRMSNEQDQKFVASAMPDGSAGMLAALPAMKRQEGIIVGEGVSVPMRIRFDDLANEWMPRSLTAPYSSSWQKDIESAEVVAETLYRWRHQVRG